MVQVAIGTAGHVDHGKTLLVKALTGTDTDRLPEEKRRGISIELGYARLKLAEDIEASLIDVPGHERFVKTMVAGTSGIDLVLLVVAADEGVRPQTREHLDICRLLGVKAGLIAINKIDLVDAARLRAVQEEIAAECRGSFLAGASMVPVSAACGDGLERLRLELGRLARGLTGRPADAPVYLPLDRAFSVRGFGTVVTGTLVFGALAVGDEVDILPDPERRRQGLKIRGLQVHGQQVERAEAGQRVAVNLTAPLELLARGQVLAASGSLLAARVFDAACQLLPGAPALRSGSRLIFYAGTAHSEASVELFAGARIESGLAAYVRLRCREEMAVLPGQGFILRGFTPLPGRGTTLAGGRVLSISPPPMRQVPRERRLEQLRLLEGGSLTERVRIELECSRQGGLSLDELSQRAGKAKAVVREAAEQLLRQGSILTADNDFSHLWPQAEAERLISRMQQVLEDFHRREPLQPGLPSEQLRSTLRPEPETRLFRRLVEMGLSAGWLQQKGNLLRLSAHRNEPAGEKIRLQERLVAMFEEADLAPPSPEEAAEKLSADPAEVVALLHHLERTGALLRLPGGMFISQTAVSRLRTRLLEYLERHGSISTQDFKALVGGTRKYVIPLAEHFDRERITVRRGNLRLPGTKTPQRLEVK